MPFFQGAYNFQTQGGQFNDNSNGIKAHNVTNNQYQSPHPQALHRQQTSDSQQIKWAQVPERQPHEKKRKPLTGFLSPFYFIYKLFLLRLPNLYLSRIERLGGNADLARERMFELAMSDSWSQSPRVPGWSKAVSIPRTGKAFLTRLVEFEGNIRGASDVYNLPASYLSLGMKWGGFVDSLLQEWQTLNLVSALLVPSVIFSEIGL